MFSLKKKSGMLPKSEKGSKNPFSWFKRHAKNSIEYEGEYETPELEDSGDDLLNDDVETIIDEENNIENETVEFPQEVNKTSKTTIFGWLKKSKSKKTGTDLGDNITSDSDENSTIRNIANSYREIQESNDDEVVETSLTSEEVRNNDTPPDTIPVSGDTPHAEQVEPTINSSQTEVINKLNEDDTDKRLNDAIEELKKGGADAESNETIIHQHESASGTITPDETELSEVIEEIGKFKTTPPSDNKEGADEPISENDADEAARMAIESPNIETKTILSKDSENDLDEDVIEVVIEEPENIDQKDESVETVGTEINDSNDLEANSQSVDLSKSTAQARPVLTAFRAGENQKRHRFGEYVHRKGLISKDALHAASLEQEVTGAKIGKILVANGFLTDKDRVAAILAIEHSRIAQEKVSRSRIPVEVLEANNIFIAAEQEDKIYIATSQDERNAKHVVKEYYPDRQIEMVAYDASAMNAFLSTMRKTSSIDDPSNSEELMLDRIVYRALTEQASDIHIFPRAESYSIFYRTDGVNRLIHTGKLEEYQVLIAKIKDKAAMDLAERRKPQDGGFQMEYSGKMIDLRVATLPVVDGAEKCVIRLLDSDRVQPSLDKLGITDVEKWRKGLRYQFGLCIVCGPTGSGKTTTLNASIREMDRFGKAIYSIEDPVEYRIPYVAQVAVNNQVGLDFASGIRAFMRSDPDVMIVGEVRDRETAENAIKAAETGHLVLATLHTGSIIGAISRLKELGIEPHELRYLVRSIMVQTLVRKVCPKCGNQEPNKFECEPCKGGGYVGRTIVSECEYFETPEDVQKIIPEAGKNIDVTWTSKEQDAVNKYYEGITDRAELDRVFGPAVERFLREEDRS